MLHLENGTKYTFDLFFLIFLARDLTFKTGLICLCLCICLCVCHSSTWPADDFMRGTWHLKLGWWLISTSTLGPNSHLSLFAITKHLWSENSSEYTRPSLFERTSHPRAIAVTFSQAGPPFRSHLLDSKSYLRLRQNTAQTFTLFFWAKAGRFRRDIHNISTGFIQYPSSCQLMLKSTICKNVEQLDTVQSCPVLITQVWLESKWTPLQGPPAKIALKFYPTTCLHNWPRPPAFMRSKPLEHLSEICQRRFFAS